MLKETQRVARSKGIPGQAFGLEKTPESQQVVRVRPHRVRRAAARLQMFQEPADHGDGLARVIDEADHRPGPVHPRSLHAHHSIPLNARSDTGREANLRASRRSEQGVHVNIVSSALGVDSAAYTFGYLASWGAEPDSIRRSGHRIQQAAQAILAALGVSAEGAV